MICPKCGTDNIGGKLLCYKCGTKLLQAPGGGPQAGKKAVRKKSRFRALSYLLLLIFLGVIFYLMLQGPEIEPLEVSPEAGRRLEAKMVEMERAASDRKFVKLEVTEEEINSQVAERVGKLRLDEEYAKQNIRVDGMQIILKGDKLKAVVTLKVKGRPVYISLWGKFVLINDKLGLTLDRVAVGRMPMLPAILRRFMRQVERGEGLPLPRLPSGVRSIRIEGGKLIVEAGPEAGKVLPVKEGEIETPKKEIPAPEVEVKPAPEKRVLTEEELEELRKRREENKAKSWLQMGDNFANNIEMYDLAIEYYQKVINKYPESEQAKKARQRVEEIKSRLESAE